MKAKRLHGSTSLLRVVLLVVFVLGGTQIALAQPQPSTPPPPVYEPELLAAVSPVYNIDGINVRDAASHEIVFGARNPGATCGGGTPASAWKMTLDPLTGDVVDVTKKQDLSLIQNLRGTLFERSDGALFTGGGWCGYKPPYYSVDGGETWQRADAGPVHPPNSTFSYAELDGVLYAGTGYAPHHGQVYRWLGGGNWELVLDIAPPRSIVKTMAVYDDRLFVGSQVYGWGGSGCASSVPVYVSSDGNTFTATTGIPPCYSVRDLLVVGDQLVARAADYFNNLDQRMYHWNDGTQTWDEIGAVALDWHLHSQPDMVAHADHIYAYGQAPGDPSAGIYRSTDLGQTWQQVAVIENPDVSALAIHDSVLYAGTRGDASNVAYIYRIPLTGIVASTADVEIYPGDTVTVDLDIVGANQLYAAQADCDVDPAVLELQNATFGGFFTSPLVGANLIDAPSGNWLGALSQQNPAGPLSGSGRFAILTSQALAPGTTAVTCEPLFADRDGFELPSSYVGLTITVIPFGEIDGTATYQGRLTHADIQITASGPVTVTTATDANGDYVIDVLKTGSYTVTADAPLYLPNCTTADVLSGQTTSLPDTVLKGGDANDDGCINIGDAALVAANFGQTVPPADSRADINDDGVVNVQDLALVGGNFGLCGCQCW